MRESNAPFPFADVTGVLIGGIWHNITTGSFRLEPSMPREDRAVRFPVGVGTHTYQVYRFVSAGDEYYGPVGAIQGVRGRAE